MKKKILLTGLIMAIAAGIAFADDSGIQNGGSQGGGYQQNPQIQANRQQIQANRQQMQQERQQMRDQREQMIMQRQQSTLQHQ